jgi:hypothetical protein
MTFQDFVRKTIRKTRTWMHYIRSEQEWMHWVVTRAPSDISLWNLLKVWWSGYMPQSELIYRANTIGSGIQEYVSDRAWKAGTTYINEGREIILSDKLMLYRFLVDHKDCLPELYGVISGGNFSPRPWGEASSFAELLKEKRCHDPEGGLVVKPTHGSEGKGVRIIRFHPREQNLCLLDGNAVDMETLCKSLLRESKTSNRQMVTAWVGNAPYAEKLYPHTPNTLRVLMMRDISTNAPFVAAAAQRIGVKKSEPVDNFTLGGLSAEVDLDTGILSAASSKPSNGQLNWYDVHPETGATIKGVAIPGWANIKEKLKGIMDEIPWVDYVGWDLLVKDDGLKILEGNAYPALRIIQIHRPLLAEPRIRQFYEAHGVVEV